MLTSIHILLTYKCNLECDHCFLFSGPRSEGTFTLPQIRHVVNEATAIGTVDWIYFEGGEPFLFYPSMLRNEGHFPNSLTMSRRGMTGWSGLAPMHLKSARSTTSSC